MIKTCPSVLSSEFFQIASLGNQDFQLLNRFIPQCSYFRINTPEEARMISRATEVSKQKRARTFFKGIEYRARLPQGLHDRGEAYCFADMSLDKKRNQAGLENHFPINVRLTSIPEKIVEENEVWDISVYPSDWEVDERTELYNLVNIGKLILKRNASVIVKGNALVFTCSSVEKLYPSEKPYDLGILPTDHGFGLRRGQYDGRHGINGADGLPGKDAKLPMIGRNFLGALLPDGITQEDMNGAGGLKGQEGEPGESGLTGGACRIAEINLRSFANELPFVIGAIGSNGGDGGNGGNGGDGGRGGNGVPAFKTFTGKYEGGHGGNGGVGGNGGEGGRAGHSGMSSHIFIDVPEKNLNKLFFFSSPGKPGRPGKGGQPGKGGLAGSSDLSEAVNGNPGNAGAPGKPGRQLPAATIYVNDEPFLSPVAINVYDECLVRDLSLYSDSSFKTT